MYEGKLHGYKKGGLSTRLNRRIFERLLSTLSLCKCPLVTHTSDNRTIGEFFYCYTAQMIKMLIELLFSLKTLRTLFGDISFNQTDLSIAIKRSKWQKQKILCHTTEKTPIEYT